MDNQGCDIQEKTTPCKALFTAAYSLKKMRFIE